MSHGPNRSQQVYYWPMIEPAVIRTLAQRDRSERRVFKLAAAVRIGTRLKPALSKTNNNSWEPIERRFRAHARKQSRSIRNTVIHLLFRGFFLLTEVIRTRDVLLRSVWLASSFRKEPARSVTSMLLFRWLISYGASHRASIGVGSVHVRRIHVVHTSRISVQQPRCLLVNSLNSYVKI